MQRVIVIVKALRYWNSNLAGARALGGVKKTLCFKDSRVWTSSRSGNSRFGGLGAFNTRSAPFHGNLDEAEGLDRGAGPPSLGEALFSSPNGSAGSPQQPGLRAGD